MFRNLAPLILASASPRRQEMLAGLGLEFAVRPAAIVEEARPGEAAPAFVARLAAEKARAVAAAGPAPGTWVLAADTVVVLAEEILGKPADSAAAAAMLSRLSGRWHTVLTGFAALFSGQCPSTPGGAAGGAAERLPAPAERLREVDGVVATEVRFAELPPQLIAAYVAGGEPLDKAGAYGLQGLGGALVREIRGSHSNVIGLPLHEVTTSLLKAGVITWRQG